MTLGHSHKQETPNGGANQGSEEADYDDRQSMFPFVEKEQSSERLPRQYTTKSDNEETNSQRGLTKWTAILAGTTGALAVATFVVAFFSWWGSIDTRRLADAARDQADTAMDTESQQLRAYVGPIFNSFKFTHRPPECESSVPAGGEIEQHTLFCYRFKNYGTTPARRARACGDIFALERESRDAINMIASRCPLHATPPSIGTVWPGEERATRSPRNAGEKIDDILASNKDIFVFFVIVYHDIFRVPHHTFICRAFDPSGFGPCPIEVPQDD